MLTPSVLVPGYATKCLFQCYMSMVQFPVIFTKCIPPAVLHNFSGTLYCASDMNSIACTALENKWILNNLNFLALKIRNPIMPSN